MRKYNQSGLAFCLLKYANISFNLLVLLSGYQFVIQCRHTYGIDNHDFTIYGTLNKYKKPGRQDWTVLQNWVC